MDFRELVDYLDKTNIEYKINEKTALYVSFKVGGKARIIVFPNTQEQFVKIINIIMSNHYKYFILGNGTNTYFTDLDFDGVVVITKNLNKIIINGEKLSALCGASLQKCAIEAMYSSLSGLEFAFGIPGTIGGAVYINAEAFNSSISDALFESKIYDIKQQKVFVIDNHAHFFDKKSSIFSKEKRYILLESTFLLVTENINAIKDRIKIYNDRRKVSQPLNLPSAGSVFKRPPNSYASLLIDRAGLKGYRIGGAEVSLKHAGFIVNVDNATSNDINLLINHIKKTIYKEYNVMLEEEIIYVE